MAILVRLRRPRILRSLLSIKIIKELPWRMSPMQQTILTLIFFSLFLSILFSASSISSEVAQISFQRAEVWSSLIVLSSFFSLSLMASLFLKPCRLSLIVSMQRNASVTYRILCRLEENPS